MSNPKVDLAFVIVQRIDSIQAGKPNRAQLHAAAAHEKTN
jgi:hypothetical protein